MNIRKKGVSMTNKISHAKSLVEGEKGKIIWCGRLDKTDYDTKYKGLLRCKNGCKARIKFTQRKNNVKFFSTWNKEGNLHREGCPYHVDYKGKVGRAKLEAFHKSIELDDETILRRLKQKMERMLQTFTEGDVIDPENGTLVIENTEEKEVPVYEGSEDGAKSVRAPYIDYEDAEYINQDEVKCRKGIYGFIDNVQLEEDKHKRKYAYFNLATKNNVVNLAFQEAFYRNESVNSIEQFETYIAKVKEMVEQNPGQIRVIAYGEIVKKRACKGVNVNIISPNRILVDNKTYHQIVFGQISN